MLLLQASLLFASDDLSIEISGAKGKLKDNILATLSGYTAVDAEDRFYKQRVEKQLRQSVEVYGYYQAEFEIQQQAGSLSIDVRLGPALRWAGATVLIDGDEDSFPALQKLVADPPFKQGRAINQGVYEAYKNQLLDLCLANGYEDARFSTSVLELDLDNGEASALLTVETGQRYRVGALTFQGSILDDKVIEMMLVSQQGDWYQRRLLVQQYKVLLDSGYFSSVNVRPEVDRTKGVVNILISLRDDHKDIYMIGAGFGTDTGIRLRFNWDKPIVNDAGHSLGINTELSEPIQTVSSHYRIPWNHPVDDFLEWVTAWQHKDVEDTDSTVTKTGINWIVHGGQWNRSFGVNLENEKYKQGSEPEKEMLYILPTANWSTTAGPRGSNYGYKYWINLQASSTQLGSDTDFFRTQVGSKQLWRWNEQHVWVLRGELGEIFAENNELVPASKRFFAGGDQSIRGFAYDSISPRDENGEFTGASKLIIGSFEHRWYFRKGWGLAAFVDTGNAYNASMKPLRTGAGIGLRSISAIGLISVDLAKPVNDDEYDGYQIHFYMGPPI